MRFRIFPAQLWSRRLAAPSAFRRDGAHWPENCRSYYSAMRRDGGNLVRGVRMETRPSLKDIADRATAEAERQAIRVALQATRGNKSEAARLLRVDYKTLYLKMKRYGIEAAEFRAS